ncbi:MAG: rane protein [Chitinophagaceae bacterium]|nr:rane protein [Chitinophagaceae bacterium]
MFKALFSFNGRIGRAEYAFTFVWYFLMILFFNAMVETMPLLGLLLFPMIWIFWAQGAKRCHDLGKIGWYQIIPFYFIALLFVKGDLGLNEYDIKDKAKIPGRSDILDSHE